MTSRLFGIVMVFFFVIFFTREIVVLRHNRALKYIFTPLVTISVILVPVMAIGETGLSPYNSFITCSLLLALAGDTLLMIEEVKLLKYGMVFFFSCHILYIAAFSVNYIFHAWNIIPALLLGSSAVIHVVRLRRTAGRMFVPVALYIAAITVMIFFGITRLNNGLNAGTLTAAAGVILFGISDYLHSVNSFIRKIENSSVYTWLFYGPAQFLIAASTLSAF